ncbi:Serine carboxypeptidase-like [Thalictrum thalictroides]|uniref:Carboxypeptidase n=1 Tax=Thalictrum thalictroides TaxID=46969 RepID=A0A7J6UW59_THATH|nr:Serine carboxypeptidase-like [Thalictrum thalictroides]
MSRMASLQFFLLILFLCSLSSFITLTEPSNTYSQTKEFDRITNLPGQPTTPPISQFSGYITVNQDHGRALFYWFFESQSEPLEKPLLLWLNGGPGCSSIGNGAAVELGPLLVKKKGDALEFNNYAWNREANLLFVESPVGVGFSYTNTSSDLTKLDDRFVAEDAYSFLVNWMEKFPQFKSHDFYISGESYAGHYVPQLAELVYDRNKDKTNYPVINLKGFIVGNPETEDNYDYHGLLDYAWSHAIISDQVYEKAKQVCNFKLINWMDECNTAMEVVFQQYQEIDIYNIYAPRCLLNNTTSSTDDVLDAQISASFHKDGSKKGLRWPRIPGGYDPCYTKYAEKYFNRNDVRLSLHANPNGKWEVCNESILRTYNYTVLSILPIYIKLIKAGLKIWVYSGDADGRVPVTGTRYWLEAIGLPLKASWRSWYHNHQVGGRIVEYEGLTFVTVRGAGHLVPLNKPSESVSLIHSYLSGEKL